MKIGLTHTGIEEKHQNYVNWLGDDSGIEIVELKEKHNSATALNDLDALILSGGVDIHPKFYHSNSTNYPHAPKSFHEERDEFEIALFKLAQETNKPVLGICRGFQLINCVMGGTLKQDLGDEQNRLHKAVVADHVQKDKIHGADIEHGTLLHAITGSSRIAVNSAHHQTIDRLGNGLRINCYSDDRLVEGFEREHPPSNNSGTLPFLLGVQWHPERMYKFKLEDSAASKAIRDRFIAEVKISIEKK
jgi:putative glutamine amidotransferase